MSYWRSWESVKEWFQTLIFFVGKHRILLQRIVSFVLAFHFHSAFPLLVPKGGNENENLDLSREDTTTTFFQPTRLVYHPNLWHPLVGENVGPMLVKDMPSNHPKPRQFKRANWEYPVIISPKRYFFYIFIKFPAITIV